MSPDRAAELLQIPERGIELLQRFNEDETIRKALQAVESGFAPADVAAMYNLPFDGLLSSGEVLLPTEGHIHVYECQTSRCRQKGRVATCSLAPDEDGVENLTACPECRQRMVFVMSVEDEADIELRRTRSPKVKFHDAMHGVDKSSYERDSVEDD